LQVNTVQESIVTPSLSPVSVEEPKEAIITTKEVTDTDTVVNVIQEYRAVTNNMGIIPVATASSKQVEPVDEFLYNQVNEECTARLPLLSENKINEIVNERTKEVAEGKKRELEEAVAKTKLPSIWDAYRETNKKVVKTTTGKELSEEELLEKAAYAQRYTDMCRKAVAKAKK
jgi:hypothetical protein